MLHIEPPAKDAKPPVEKEQPAPAPLQAYFPAVIITNRRPDEAFCERCGTPHASAAPHCANCSASTAARKTKHHASTAFATTRAKWPLLIIAAALLLIFFGWQ